MLNIQSGWAEGKALGNIPKGMRDSMGKDSNTTHDIGCKAQKNTMVVEWFRLKRRLVVKMELFQM